jgi:hypothetical protein
MEEPLPTIPAGEPGQRPGSDWSRVQGPGTSRPPSPMNVGRLIGTSFRAWARNALLFGLLGAVGNVPMAFAMHRFYSWMPAVLTANPPNPEELLADMSKFMGSFFLAWMASLVTVSLVMAAVCQGTSQALHGQRVRPGAMLAAAIHRAPYVLAVTLLATLAWMATACTLVLPFILLVGWCAAVPATVLEQAGPIRALSRSWELSRGYRWQICAVLAVITVSLMGAGLVIQNIVTAIVRAVSGPPAIDPREVMRAAALPVAIGQVFGGMLGTLTTVSLTAIHRGLRTAKEGGEPEVLARVFE